MKHAITVLMLLILSYGTWRMWPRSMSVTVRPQHIPMADWKTADYESRYIYSQPYTAATALPACLMTFGVTSATTATNTCAVYTCTVQ